MILRSPGGGIEAFASGPFEGVAPEEDVEGAFFLLEEVVDVFLEIGGDLVQGGGDGVRLSAPSREDQLEISRYLTFVDGSWISEPSFVSPSRWNLMVLRIRDSIS